MSATYRFRNLSVGTLFILALASFAQEESTPAAPANSSLNSDAARMMNGLSKATPVSRQSNFVISDTLTPSEGLFSFDMESRRSFRVSSGILRAAPDTPGMEKGNPGAFPDSADADSSFAPKSESAGETEAASTNLDGFTRTDINPTPPIKILRPYTFPLRTQFRLLLRFTIPGASDVYHLCSASSVSHFHLLVAAECIYNHSPDGTGSANGAGFATEIWAWPAETDVVSPIDPTYWPDLPYGVAKATRQTVYNAWINNKDPNWDIGFITLDRRIGDRVGWMGREWGVQATSLRYSGYSSLKNPPNLFYGFDPGNVKFYTSSHIVIFGTADSGEEGGGVWRYNGTDRFLHGVIAGMNTNNALVANRLTAQNNSDLNRRIQEDEAEKPPVDRAELIEYVLDNSSKALLTKTVFIGEKMEIKLNAFNVGYIPAVGTKADIYLVRDGFNTAHTPSEDITNKGILIGTVDLGTLGANKFTVQTHSITIPHSVPVDYYFVGWVLRSSTTQYGGDRKAALLDALFDANGLLSVKLDLYPTNQVVGGTSVLAIAFFLTDVTRGIDVALSSDNPAAHVPPSARLHKSDEALSFNVETTPVPSKTTATITATYGGISKKVKLTILPPPSAKPTAQLTP
jgi:hypothetical protein